MIFASIVGSLCIWALWRQHGRQDFLRREDDYEIRNVRRWR